MNRRKNNKGFTMAELILVVAIIAVLAALVFVGVTRYLRSLRLMEMDNAAKEIYFAAQNRITASLVSGDLGRLKAGDYSADATQELTIDDDSKVTLHVAIGPGAGTDTLLDEFLPFGSIDETIRGGGSYIITYTFDAENNLADVWDVWYTSEWRGVDYKFKRDKDELITLYTNTRGDANKEQRKNYNGAVIGHYGSKGVSIKRSKLAVTLELINDEVLYLKGKVTVDDKPDVPISNVVNPQVNIIVEGMTSGAVRTLIPLKSGVTVKADDGSFSFVLDDITTAKKRFRDQFSEVDEGSSAFIFGEDIRVTVEVYSNDTLANIDRATAVDNSLFQYVKKTTDNVGTTTTEAGIGKIRHLQNLSSEVSGVNYSNENTRINKALQTDDLTWVVENSEHNVIGGFKNFSIDGGTTKLGGNISYNDTSKTTDSFYPIDVSTQLVYEAGYKDDAGKDKRHTINNLVVSGADDAGLFGTVRTPTGTPLDEGDILLTVQNLEMNGAGISGKDTAGVVIANEVNAAKLSNISISAATVKATGGNAGGAVGKAANGLDLMTVTVTGNTQVSAANGNAGGLLGEMNGAPVEKVHLTISDSAVGDKESRSIAVASSGAGKAGGGLVGAITDGLPTITNSYSTALVSGDTAGGLVGTVEKCYPESMIKSSYVGGHTVNAKYETDAEKCNIRGTTTAGGFIGKVGEYSTQLSIQSSYSTASASGQIAGGFIGQTKGGNVSKCYAVGYVKDTNPESAATDSHSGAFIGENEATLNNCLYFELVNKGLPAVGSNTSAPGITAAETDLGTYNAFVQFGAENEADQFDPYDPMLTAMFGNRYFLPTVKEWSGENNAPTTHIGDWQPVDTLVVNTPGA